MVFLKIRQVDLLDFHQETMVTDKIPEVPIPHAHNPRRRNAKPKEVFQLKA